MATNVTQLIDVLNVRLASVRIGQHELQKAVDAARTAWHKAAETGGNETKVNVLGTTWANVTGQLGNLNDAEVQLILDLASLKAFVE